MELLSSLNTMGPVFLKIGYSLRYELTCCLALIVFWIAARFAGVGQKTHSTSKVASSPTAQSQKKPCDVNSLSTASPISIQAGRADQVDSRLLRDPSWLVPQVTRMCRAQVQNALALYRAAIQAGLDLKAVPSKDREQLFEALVTSAIRTSHIDEAKQLFRDLRKHGLGVCASLFASSVKLCTSKHMFAECLSLYDFIVEDATFSLTDKTIWSCLLFCAIEVRDYQRGALCFNRLKACGTPSQKDYGNMVRLASVQKDWNFSLELIKDMQKASIDTDSVICNTALATCVVAEQVDHARTLLEDMERTKGLADVITYNTLMKGYAKAGRLDQCIEIFERLKMQSIAPSQVTYGILLDACINDNQLDRAADVFSTMRKEGCTMNTVLYTTLIKGFSRGGQVDQAMDVYEQMRAERNVAPDLITFSILIKATCDADRLEDALNLLKSMLARGLKPDEVVFNNLLTGCVRQANAELGKRLYTDMVATGIKPSNATFSILIRLFHQCKLLEEAIDILRVEPAKHKLNVEPRVFLQLIQSCIRERQGRRAVEAYELFMGYSMPTASAHGSILATCVKLNMYDTASEILALAAAKGGRVNAEDATSILEGAVRKRKTQIAEDVANSMGKLGLAVNVKLH